MARTKNASVLRDKAGGEGHGLVKRHETVHFIRDGAPPLDDDMAFDVKSDGTLDFRGASVATQGTSVNVIVPNVVGQPTGWLLMSEIEKGDLPPIQVGPVELAWECAFQEGIFGISAHYLAAIAKLRSSLLHDLNGTEAGLFKVRAAEWAADWKTAEFKVTFPASEQYHWRTHCAHFALMARRAFDSYVDKFGKNPTATDLYLTQLIGAEALHLLAGDANLTVDKALEQVGVAGMPLGSVSPHDQIDRYKSILKKADKACTLAEMRATAKALLDPAIAATAALFADKKVTRASTTDAFGAPPEGSDDYLGLWETMTVFDDWKSKAKPIADRIVANKARYEGAVAGTSVPWWFVAIVQAMEADFNFWFQRHLHNGDPLTARTVQHPAGRPATGAPPFTWEQSAQDAMEHQKLTKIARWPLVIALFQWHRYNGVENEYKRRGIPTPYLWSGSQHYSKGKYVRDGVFDSEAVSQQVGAAVLLRILVDRGAVQLDAAADEPEAVAIDTAQPGFAHVEAELAYPGPLAIGALDAQKLAVRRVQEWLRIHKAEAPVNGVFDAATANHLMAFQAANGRPVTGQLDAGTWVLLTAPMRRALAKVDLPAGTGLEDAVVAIAKQHIDQGPIEVVDNNRGPWVRLYMEGKEGGGQLWCAGFVCFVIAQAVHALNAGAMPFNRQVSVPLLAKDAKNSGRFVAAGELATAADRAAKLRPGQIFVIQDGPGSWSHTGFVLAVNDGSFDTLEGNFGKDGGKNGPNARQGSYTYGDKDFLNLI